MGAIKLPYVLCMHVQFELHGPTAVAGALRNKRGRLLNTHSFRRTKHCDINGSHLTIWGTQKGTGKELKIW